MKRVEILLKSPLAFFKTVDEIFCKSPPVSGVRKVSKKVLIRQKSGQKEKKAPTDPKIFIGGTPRTKAVNLPAPSQTLSAFIISDFLKKSSAEKKTKKKQPIGGSH